MKLQITVDGRAYEVDVELMEEEEALPEQHSPLAPPEAFKPPAAIAPSYPVVVSTDPKVCRSPVMGLVIKVNVEPGQAVEAGELIVVLEAMKMETNVTAPHAAVVKSVLVKPGDSAKLNQPIVEFE